MLKSDEQDAGSNRTGFDYLKATLSASLSPESRARIDNLVQEVTALKDIEKLLFCLLLPIDGGPSQHSFVGSSLGAHPDDSDLSGHGFELNTLGVGLFSPGGPSALHLSNQVEQSQAYTWIMSHLEEDQTTCLRKDEVYDDYRAYCDKHHMKPLNTADFGKVMKRAFPNVKPRRLGQRGQSRYCYGGMRKRTEVQPPFLPDLSEEAGGNGVNGPTGQFGRSTASPTSSSECSGPDSTAYHRRRVPSASPLTRLLLTNGADGDGGGAAAASWADEATVRLALGVRGTVVSDVANILLEYAQQVFGAQFQSLFHLAHHLVAHRYVNSRSRHAFALIAHAAAAANASASGNALSPPPSAALAEALQKGLQKSAFDRVGAGSLKTDGSERLYVKSEVEGSLHSPVTPTTPSALHPALNVATRSPITPRGYTSALPPSNASSTPNPANATVNTATCRSYHTNFSPQVMAYSTPSTVVATTATPTAAVAAAATTTTNNMYATAAALMAQSAQSTLPPYLTYSAPSQITTGGGTGLQHSSATVALASLMAAHQRANLAATNSPTTYPSSANNNTPTTTATANHTSPSPVARTPPVAHKDRTTGSFTTLSNAYTPAELAYSQMTNYYLSPAAAVAASMYAAQHNQQHPPSPYLASMQQQQPQHQQPPAPLPPGVGARSPYTQTANPATGVSTDSSQMNYKRAALQQPPHPVDAPGAYEPSPRFHLGGHSPNKRVRYLSTASSGASSSGASANSQPTGTECQLVQPHSTSSMGTTPAGAPDPMASASPSGSSSGGGVGMVASATRNLHHYHHSTTGNGYSPALTDKQAAAATMASPYYTARYEGLEMRSPAPHRSSHQQTPGDNNGPLNHRLPTLTPASYESSHWGPVSINGGTPAAGGQTPYSMSATSNNEVFRPPITPFTVDLEDDDDLTNLPRLGASPGPQIPPSSPTEFLPFYSEAASKSAQSKQRQHGANTDQRSKSHATPESEESSSSPSDSYKLSICTDHTELRGFVVSSDTNLETPPSSAINLPSSDRLCCSDGGLTSPVGSDDSACDRTLINFDSYGQVNTPPSLHTTSRLTIVTSPTDCGRSSPTSDPSTRERENLQFELSTPGPADSPTLQTDSTTNSVAHNNSADVSITAF